MQKIIKTDVPLVKDMVCEVQQECEVRQEWSSDCPCCAQRFWKLILASTTIAKTAGHGWPDRKQVGWA